jgi:hypothetical protein
MKTRNRILTLATFIPWLALAGPAQAEIVGFAPDSIAGDVVFITVPHVGAVASAFAESGYTNSGYDSDYGTYTWSKTNADEGLATLTCLNPARHYQDVCVYDLHFSNAYSGSVTATVNGGESVSVGIFTLGGQPSGQVTGQVTNTANLLWDFSKLTNELQEIAFTNQSFALAYSDAFTQDGRGKFSGFAAETAATVVTGLGNDSTPFTNDITAPYIVSGSVTSSKGKAKCLFTTKLSGGVESDSRARNFVFSESCTITFDALAGEASGRWSLSAKLSGGGGPTRTSSTNGTYGPFPLTDYLAEAGDGTWTLALTFDAASGDKLGGTATVTLNSGQVYPFNFSGTYAPHTGQSKLNLKGVDAGAGSVLQVTLQGSSIIQIAGQVSGQSISLKE